ncbi:phasin family protein [uncultured Alsobacter sp.]|uniref:phasin family protein n=1 Tax=uncultured Alsobacter sp. TaxID=1748258 RepID=UPI0025E991AB|nr:phasin family protein [uncultured Alsobacter sp.]
MADDKQKFRTGIHRAEERAGIADTSAGAEAIGEGVSRMAEQTSTFAQDSLRGFGAVSDASIALASTFQDVSREMASIVEDGWRHHMDGMSTLASCRTMPELMAAQAAFAKQSLDRAMEAQRRLAEVVLRSARSAGDTVTSAAQAGMERAA